eukprot:COSAG06_NODE_3890_length_4801_cov_2.569545_2_plen_171_part_00
MRSMHTRLCQDGSTRVCVRHRETGLTLCIPHIKKAMVQDAQQLPGLVDILEVVAGRASLAQGPRSQREKPANSWRTWGSCLPGSFRQLNQPSVSSGLEVPSHAWSAAYMNSSWSSLPMHMHAEVGLIRVVTGSQLRNSPLAGAHLHLHDLPLQPPPAAAPAFVSLLPFVA